MTAGSRTAPPSAPEALLAALEELPSAAGGAAVVLATAGPPPAMALVSTGGVWLDGPAVLVALQAGTTAAARLGGAFSLLVPAGSRAFRVEVDDATAAQRGSLVLLRGRLVAVRATAEAPWSLELRFVAPAGADVGAFVGHWEAVRAWLRSGASGPVPPAATRYHASMVATATEGVSSRVQR